MNKRLTYKTLFCLLVVSLIIVYVVLSWLQAVPSVLHVTVVRKIWDQEFSKCMIHIEKERSLVPSKRHPHYLTVKLSGRLGNWMFAYASLLGIASRNNVEFYTRPDADQRVSLPRLFKVKNVKSITPLCSQSMYEQLPGAYDPKFELLPLSNITIHGYLQSWKYFKHVENKVRKELTLHNHLITAAKKILHHDVGDRLKDSEQLTCVHIRRTDMIIPSSTKLGFKTAPLEYIHNAMKHFREKFQEKVHFIVISDDYRWCSKNLKFSNVTVLPRNSQEIDFTLLTLCNSSIITTGTFGWWGAWLANGYTVYYKNYPEPGSKLDRDTVHEDYYPPHWVAVDGAEHVFPSYYMFLFLSVHLFQILLVSSYVM